MEWLGPRVVNLTVPFLRCFLNFVLCPTANVCNMCSPTFLFCVQSVGKLLHSVCFAPQCYISMHHAKEDLSLQCVKKAPWGKSGVEHIRTRIAVVQKSLWQHTPIWIRQGSIVVWKIYTPSSKVLSKRHRFNTILKSAVYMQWWPLTKVTILLSQQYVLAHLSKKNVFTT